MPLVHAGRPPRNKGMRYPADPPAIEEIVAFMQRAGDDVHGRRLRGLIVVLWRAGLLIHEALALAEADLDPRRGALLVRRRKGGRRREVGMDDRAWDPANTTPGVSETPTAAPRRSNPSQPRSMQPQSMSPSRRRSPSRCAAAATPTRSLRWPARSRARTPARAIPARWLDVFEVGPKRRSHVERLAEQLAAARAR